MQNRGKATTQHLKKKGRKNTPQNLARQKSRNFGFPSRLINLMTNKIVHHDRNGHITSNFFRFDAMISSLQKLWACKVVKNKDPNLHLLQEHGSRHGKVLHRDCSDRISHTTY